MTVDPGVDRLELLGVVALGILLNPVGHLLDGGAAQMRPEPQQILDAEMLLPATPGNRLQPEFPDSPRDPRRADVD